MHGRQDHISASGIGKGTGDRSLDSESEPAVLYAHEQRCSLLAKIEANMQQDKICLRSAPAPRIEPKRQFQSQFDKNQTDRPAVCSPRAQEKEFEGVPLRGYSVPMFRRLGTQRGKKNWINLQQNKHAEVRNLQVFWNLNQRDMPASLYSPNLGKPRSSQLLIMGGNLGHSEKPVEGEERSLQADKADKLVNGDRGLGTECTAKGCRLRMAQ
ncbi:hypothetical protein DFH08DRAFT_821496 [Mycena albidolilacea]|uniref:Uncharacterized protein n=1 Tax=Mycena albidolilacea TaxID=1033008 RepID=A0AAD6ZBG2_9AGAR|nr:hypothetical protein DFH08DRAFT_821496 [Mycena albidolilacea]